MGIGVWHKFALTGGGVTALDGIATASIADSDVCHVYAAGKYYYMVFDADATDAESSPNVIRPDDYSTAGVWKIGGSPYGDVQVQPEIVSGLPITGGITGGVMSKTAANTVTITPTTCLDSGLTTKLYTSANATVAIPSVASTIYHIFLVKLVSGGTFEFRAYTTEAAVAADAQVDKYRWIGFVRTNGSNAICEFSMNGNVIRFGKASENVAGTVGTSFTTVTHSSLIPTDRVAEIKYGARHASSAAIVHATDDGTNSSGLVANAGTTATGDTEYSAWGTYHHARFPLLTTRQFKSNFASTSLLIHEVVVKR